MVLAPVIEMARLVTPTMVKQGSGAFVNVTTFAAYEPSLIFPVLCTYRAGWVPLLGFLPTVTQPKVFV